MRTMLRQQELAFFRRSEADLLVSRFPIGFVGHLSTRPMTVSSGEWVTSLRLPDLE